jgi:hypothetical protein
MRLALAPLRLSRADRDTKIRLAGVGKYMR